MQTGVVIAGGGMVGASLALALAQVGIDVTLVEAVPLKTGSSPSFDDRTTALSNGSRRIMEGLGVWPLVAHEATPIRRIHISDRGHFGLARIDAAELDLESLGFVIANRALGAGLWQRLEASGVRVVAPARVVDYTATAGRCEVRLEGEAAGTEPIRCRLLVAADGAQSAVRRLAGVDSSTWDYEQTALTANLTTQLFHDHVAYERFTPTGPIALLPFLDGRVGLVWTLAPKDAEETLALPDSEFLERLQQAFGMRMGRFLSVGKRQAYPLALTRADEQVAERVVILGNAAQGLHPIAGQGFNLGLRDVACLAEVLADARASAGNDAQDPGDAGGLTRYRDWRQEDRRRIVAFTDGLVRVFRQPFGPVRLLRDFALLAFDLSPQAKHAMSRLSHGAAGRIPRLARGARL
jgi:2-octaprenyl-6-methoxyphenol hydroxylase